MNISTYSVSSDHRRELERIAQDCSLESGYKWLSSTEMPSVIPQALKEKMPSAILMWERTSVGSIYLVCNGIRIDEKDSALDQEPFGIIVHSSGGSTFGIFIHHGDWNNRSVPITGEVRKILQSTSLSRRFPLGEIPSKSSGPLSDLKETSHEKAFRRVIQVLEHST